MFSYCCGSRKDIIRSYKLSNLDRPQLGLDFPDHRAILEYWDYHGNLEDIGHCAGCFSSRFAGGIVSESLFLF